MNMLALAREATAGVYVSASDAAVTKCWTLLCQLAQVSPSVNHIMIGEKDYPLYMTATYTKDADRIDYEITDPRIHRTIVTGFISTEMPNSARTQAIVKLVKKAKTIFTAPVATMRINEMGSVVNGYLKAALFSTTYQGEDPDIDADENSDDSFQDVGYDTDDFSTQAIKSAKSDIGQFFTAISNDIEACKDFNKFMSAHEGDAAEEFGMNFWYSRNGHGTGFFDDRCDVLQKLARSFKEVNLYANEDGEIECE